VSEGSVMRARAQDETKPKTQIPNPKPQKNRVTAWDLGFGIWDLGFLSALSPARR